MTLAFMSFGLGEMLVVAVIALLVFGGNLPEVMRTLGQTYAKFRRSMHEFSRPVREEMRQLTRLPNEAPIARNADLDDDASEAADEDDTEPAPVDTWVSEAATDIGDGTVPEQALPPPDDDLEDDLDEPPPV